MERYNGAILAYEKAHGVPVVDDSEAIPPDAEHFSDCMHIIDKGADRMADRFLRFLRSSDLFDAVVARRNLVSAAGRV